MVVKANDRSQSDWRQNSFAHATRKHNMGNSFTMGDEFGQFAEEEDDIEIEPMLDRARRLNSITNRLMLRGVLAFEDHRREISSSQQFASSDPEDNNLNGN